MGNQSSKTTSDKPDNRRKEIKEYEEKYKCTLIENKYDESHYKALNDLLKTRRDFYDVLKYISDYLTYRCDHGNMVIYHCEECQYVKFEIEHYIIEKSVEYAMLFPKMTCILRSPAFRGDCIMAIEEGHLTQQEIDHINNLRPIVAKIFAFYDACVKENINDYTIISAKSAISQYREIFDIKLEVGSKLLDNEMRKKIEKLDKIVEQVNKSFDDEKKDL